MRLLNTETLLLRDFKTSNLPPYAVLSHIWTKSEITYNDMKSSRKDDDITTPEDTDYSDSDADSDVGGAPSAVPSFRPSLGRRMSRQSTNQRRSISRARSLHRSGAYSDTEPDSEQEAPDISTPHTGASSEARSEFSGTDGSPSPELYKIRRALQAAAREKIKWLWVDSCCVNEKSQSDKYEAVTNAWNLFANSAVCFVYLMDFTMPDDLDDMDQAITSDEEDDDSEDGGAGLRRDRRSVPNPPTNWRKAFRCSQWFRRAWTLPELLAPRRIIFMDRNWDNISAAVPHPDVLNMLISQSTGIPQAVLQRRVSLDSVNVATKMTWMADRRSSRPEDISYALAGLFNVHIDVRYGEGAKRAFQRLQHAILETSVDESILLWDSWRTYKNERTGLLADRPEQFLQSDDLAPAPAPLMPHRATWSITNRGLKASLFMTPHASPSTVGNFRRVWLNMFRRDSKEFMCFFVQQVGDADEYARVGPIVPVATNFIAFAKEREQHTIVVAHTVDDEAGSVGSPSAGLSFRSNGSSSIGGAGAPITGTRPHVRFMLDSGVRRVVPHTPHHKPSWTVKSTVAECLSPIPHEDYHVAIVQFELKTPSHAAKLEGKFLVVACLRLLPEVGRWQCALRIDEAEDYTNEMPGMGSTRALRDAPSASPRTMAQLDVGIEGTREIRAEVIEWIEWHESAFEVTITCPAPLPTAHPSVAADRDRIFRGTTPLNLNTGVGMGINSIPGSARSRQRFAGPPPVSGYPPLSAASQRIRMGRSMSVDHGTSPYIPPTGPLPPPGSSLLRRDREMSPPPSLRGGIAARKRDSWGGPPIAAPPTPLSPPRRPTTTRPSIRRPPSRYGHAREEYSPEYGPGPGVGAGSYEKTPLFPGSRGRRDSSNYIESMFGSEGPRTRTDPGRQSWSDRFWDRPVIDESITNDDHPIAPPSRRGTWTPAPGHSNFGLMHNHGRGHSYSHSQSFQGCYDRDRDLPVRHHDAPPAAPMLSPGQAPMGGMSSGVPSIPPPHQSAMSGRVGRLGSFDEGPWGENLRSPTIVEGAMEQPFRNDYQYYRR
ncbi:hypothetical protein Cpir12675_001251 [Ceratocystis pirilliformis]|uniref:Heterokaryon incompatibility domain-containing protein n=1 Tax=Ceratocystis pirilliformis TaxID=259994 RepID=A0ABR3ZH67_9PEZI